MIAKARRRWLQRFVGRTYQQRLMAVFLALTLLPGLLASVWAVASYRDALTNEWHRSNREELERAAESLNLLAYSTVEKSLFLNHNLQLIQFLKHDYAYDMVKYLENLQNVTGIMEALHYDPMLASIRLYTFNGSLYENRYMLPADRLPARLMEDVLSDPGLDPYWAVVGGGSEAGRFDIKLYSKILDLSEPLAITEFTLTAEQWSRSLGYPLPRNSFMLYVADAEQSYLFHANDIAPEAVPSIVRQSFEFRESASHAVFEADVPVSGHKLRLYVDSATIDQRIRRAMCWAAAATVGMCVMIFFAVRAVTKVLTRRLQQLIRKTSLSIELQSSDASEPMQRQDEFGLLDAKFSELVFKIRDYYQVIKDYEVERQKHRMELLQVNINPHFLYNSLSAIKWTYRDDSLSRLIDDMVDYYRIFLNRGETELPLRREIEMTKAYLDIQRFAYGSDFTYGISVEPEVEETTVLKNLLQPVAENAIVHGVNGLRTGGRIEIEALREGEDVHIVVRDNGVGMTAEQVLRLFASRDAATRSDGIETQPFQGYGLHNVRERIRVYYGEAYDVTVRSEIGQGTTVRFRLPIRNA